VKAPSKGEGVPREARGGTFVTELARALAPVASAEVVERAAESRGFYESALLQQWRILSEVAVELAGADALPALERSSDERVRGVAPMAVRLLHLKELPIAVAHLRRQCALPGTSIQEGAQMVLKLVFLEHGLKPTLALVRDWVIDPAPEVRRCLVEALRPRGVWTAHLPDLRRDPEPLAPILEKVLDDPSLYVRKAVANCLNDVGKDNPDTLLRWSARWAGGGPERRWSLARGLRSLVKSGHPEALRLVGLTGLDALTAQWIGVLPERVLINQHLLIELEVANAGPDPARVLAQATLSGPGRGNAPRVRRYRIGTAEVLAGEAAVIAGRIHFVDFNSQPKLAGTYELSVDVNGQTIETRRFEYEPVGVS
jgi:3-methyladenine DNA glycosylase AlkC